MMEFTPKKQTGPNICSDPTRHNPYASGGNGYMRKYKQRSDGGSRFRPSYVTPPRRGLQKRFFASRTERIVNSATKTQPQSQPDSESTCKRWLNKPEKPSQAIKRPFGSANNENSKDRYNIFSDDDDDFTETKNNNSSKPSWLDKENRLPVEKSQPAKFYSNKRKSLKLSKSKLFSDISPEKVEKAYGVRCVTESEEKENVVTHCLSEPTPVKKLKPHLIGFSNYGNTCYLNSVMQSLLGLPSLLSDCHQVSSRLDPPRTSLFHSVLQVLCHRTKGEVAGVKQSLKTVKENLERVDESFYGFKMQDANEFLTRVLDTIKDEIDRCHMTTPSPQASPTSHSSTTDIDEDIFLSGRLGRTEKSTDSHQDGESLGISNPCVSSTTNVGTPEGTNKEESFERNENEEMRSSGITDVTPVTMSDQEEVVLPRNPVKDNFEFQLLESYRCLGCGEVEGRKQEYFGLYVNLPEGDGDSQSIQDVMAAYLGADQRELKCDKCGHNQSSVLTSVTKLPRILIVQLKRYKYKPEECECVKMSSRVRINRWVTLDEFTSDSVASPSQWDPQSSSSVLPRASKQATLTVRNLSSELNVCEKESEAVADPPKPLPEVVVSIADTEDEELQEVMRRSLDEVGGDGGGNGGQEEEEIQQAIRLSLQELGMSYSHENEEEQADGNSVVFDIETEKEEGHRHTYQLVSVISHFGLTTNTGHYVSDVYNCEEDAWFHYDDESVAQISESVVFAEGRQKNGYIFFYMHNDIFEAQKKTQKSSR